MTDPIQPQQAVKPGRRAAQTASALSKATSRVVKVVTDEAVAQAFPFASLDVVSALAEQTRRVLEHNFADRWESLTTQVDFVELCNSLDAIEEDALARAASGQPPATIPTDPTLSLPPLILKVMTPLLANYTQLVASQQAATTALHSDILRKAREVERLEGDVRNSCNALQRAVDELEGGAGAKGNGVDWDRLRRTREEGAEMVGEKGL